MRNKLCLVAAICLVSSPALAGEPCRSAKDLVKVAQSFYGDNPELTNIITPVLNLSIKGTNGSPDPSAILYRFENEEEILPIVDGQIVGFDKAATWSKGGEMCRLIDGELAPVTEGDTAQVSIGFAFPYKRTDGVFSIDEIKEGAKDGSKVMKSLAPGGLGFAVPGLKAVAISPAGESTTTPTFVFSRKGTPVSVKSIPLKTATYIRLKHIKSSKADTLTISGPYVITATFKFDPEEASKTKAKPAAEPANDEN